MRRLIYLIALLAGVTTAPLARAALYTDDLTRCLVKSTTPADQLQLMQWIFAAIALHPAVQPFATITDAQRANLTTQAARLFVRLLSKDCRSETVNAVKFEGPAALQTSFTVLGQIAVRGLMSEQHVAAGMQGLSTDMNANPDLAGVLEAAGIKPPPPTEPRTPR